MTAQLGLSPEAETRSHRTWSIPASTPASAASAGIVGQQAASAAHSSGIVPPSNELVETLVVPVLVLVAVDVFGVEVAVLVEVGAEVGPLVDVSGPVNDDAGDDDGEPEVELLAAPLGLDVALVDSEVSVTLPELEAMELLWRDPEDDEVPGGSCVEAEPDVVDDRSRVELAPLADGVAVEPPHAVAPNTSNAVKRCLIRHMVDLTDLTALHTTERQRRSPDCQRCRGCRSG